MELKNVEKLEKSIVALTIEISADELEAAKEQAYKKSRNRITVPGFRKGHAPRKIIENLYGDGVFFEDALNICYPKAYEEAVKQADIKAVAPADVNVSDMTDAGAVVLVCKVPVEPEVTLGEYKGLSVEKEEAKVLAADVKAELDRMAQRLARTQTVERAAKKNDTVSIDFEGFVDGTAFEGGKGENYELKLGSGTFIPGFEDQLIGTKAGDEKDVVVTFPEEYHAKELAGKEATFKCKVHEVKETITPAIDDEFAKDVSEKAETLDDLKKEVKERLLAQKSEVFERDYEEALLTAVIDGMQADIPEAMIEVQLDNVMQDFSYRLQMQGMKMDQYAKMSGMDMQQLRGMFRPQAERQVKVRLALQKIVETENIDVTEDEVAAKYKELAEQYGMQEEQVKKALPADTITSDMKLDKAIALIKDSAKPKKKTKKKAEAKAEDKAEDKAEESAE
ncbi:MAG TPA: trigger factor [Candidatus Butyricicoccus avicola]|nr:trigger factor [Candidatus Butyricicoccus avicola]